MVGSHVLLRGASVFDGTGEQPRGNTSILVRDGRIETVARADDLPPPEGVDVVDAAGKFVMPGLIDMHVHVQLSGGDDGLLAWLGMGVTSIRDVGGAPDYQLTLRAELADGRKTGPRLFTYGPMLDGVPTIFGNRPGVPGLTPLSDLTWALEDVAAAERAADELLARGVDGLKIYAGLRPDLVRAVIRRVDGRVPVTGHLSRTWASEAIEAGINCLEHVHATVYQDVVPPEHRHPREEGNGFIPSYWTWLNTGWANADLEADYVNRFVELLVSHDVALSPTTVLITGGMATSEALEEPGLKYTPKAMAERRRLQAEQMQRMRERMAAAGTPPPPPPDPETGRRAREMELRFLKKVFDAGGTVVPSTDCGAAPGQVPGFSLHRELALFVEAGIPNADVLRLATSGAARVLRKDGEVGTISPGKRADLLVLSGNPLEDINRTRSIELVVKDGQRYEPGPLLERAASGT